MPEEFIKKNIFIKPEAWKRLKEYSKTAARRAPGYQGGVIIEEYLDNLEKEAEKMNEDFKIGDNICHNQFKNGVVVRLNMSGPVVKFEDHEHEMCVPFHELWRMEKVVNNEKTN